MTASGDLVFIGDVHLRSDDPDLPAFLRCLDRLGDTASRLVLMGDLFDLWIGREEMEELHHRQVVERLTELRRRGVVVRYLEGNRDYRIGSAHAGGALDDASDEGLEEVCGGVRLYASHGDLVNLDDRQYRLWRRFSRSRPMWALFNLIPRRRRLKLAYDLEQRLRETNTDFRQEFPEDQVRRYASVWLGQGYDAVVLGHFHVEKDLTATGPGAPGRILVLPEWKGSRRHLRVAPDGEMAFVDSE